MANLPPRQSSPWEDPAPVPSAPRPPADLGVPLPPAPGFAAAPGAPAVPPPPAFPAGSAPAAAFPPAPLMPPIAPAAPITPATPVAPAAAPEPIDPASSFAPPAVSSSASFEAFEGVDDFDDEFEATVVISRAKSTTAWSLVDIDGTKFPLATQNVLGRRPRTGPDGAQFIALSDPERVLSRTHLLIEVEDNQLWVTDLKSTNGTEIVPAAQAGTGPDDVVDFLPCEALNRYAVTADQSLSLGGRSITFTGPAA